MPARPIPCAEAIRSGDRSGSVHPGRFAVTLIELLVVLAIILVLIALSLPAAKALRSEADKLACSSNLSSLAKATLAAAKEDGGYLPGNTCIGIYSGLGPKWLEFGQAGGARLAGTDLAGFFDYGEDNHWADRSFVYSLPSRNTAKIQFPGTSVSVRGSMPWGWWAIRPYIDNVESQLCPGTKRNGSLFSPRRRYGGDLLLGRAGFALTRSGSIDAASEPTAAELIEPYYQHLAVDSGKANLGVAHGPVYAMKGTNVFGYNLATAWKGGLFWDTLATPPIAQDWSAWNPTRIQTKTVPAAHWSGGGGQPWGLAQAWTTTAWNDRVTPANGAVVNRTADPRAARYREVLLQRLPENGPGPSARLKAFATRGFRLNTRGDFGKDRSATPRDIEYHTWQSGKVVAYKTNAAIVYWLSPIDSTGTSHEWSNIDRGDHWGSYAKTSQIDAGECVLLNDYFRYEQARGLNDAFVFPQADSVFSAGGADILTQLTPTFRVDDRNGSIIYDRIPTHRMTYQLMPFLFAHDQGGNVAFADGSVRWLSAPQRLDPGLWGPRKPDSAHWDQSAISGYLDTTSAGFIRQVVSAETSSSGLVPPRPWTPMPCNY